MVLHLPLHVTWKWKAALFQSHKETPDYSLFFSVQKVLQAGLPDSAWGLEREKVKDSSSLHAGKFFGRISGAPWEMCSANKSFLEWVTHLASNHQIRPHKSELVVHGQALRSALFRVISAGSRIAFSPALNGHLCCYPWCSPFGKGIKKPFKALASELRMREDWGLRWEDGPPVETLPCALNGPCLCLHQRTPRPTGMTAHLRVWGSMIYGQNTMTSHQSLLF